MYARILKFLTNLLFKRIFMGFLTRRKKREPSLYLRCQGCGSYFTAFNKRQKICAQKYCRKVRRAMQYRAGLERKRLEARKATIEGAMRRDSFDLESEE